MNKPLLHSSGIIFFLLFVFTATPQSYGALSTKTEIPEFSTVSEWMNTSPIAKKDLLGKVVLIQFWSYSAIESVRMIPVLNRWYEKYGAAGLTVIGIHRPHFAFEKVSQNLQKAVPRLQIKYPVASDPEGTLWEVYGAPVLPTRYLIDPRGRIRYHLEGEGQYEDWELLLQNLLIESGLPPSVKPDKIKSTFFLDKIKTPNIELSYQDLSSLGNIAQVKAEIQQTFSLPKELKKNHFYLTGQWKFNREGIRLMKSPGALTIRYNASRVYLVMGVQNSKPVSVNIRLDGNYVPRKLGGKDLSLKGQASFLPVSDYRLYSAVDCGSQYGEHIFELQSDEPGLEIFEISFS